MTDLQTTKLTQLLFVSSDCFNFAHVISDLAGLLANAEGTGPQITWDCEDLVTLETATARLVVGTGDVPHGAAATHLTLALAPTISAPSAKRLARTDDRVRLWLSNRYRPDWVVTGAADCLPTVATFEGTAIQMARGFLGHDLPPTRQSALRARISDDIVSQFLGRMSVMDAQSKAQANRMAHPAVLRPTLAMRTATQLFNLTLVMVAMPLGLALLALSCWRGADMRLSAHCMVIAGLFVSGINAQSLAALHAVLGA